MRTEMDDVALLREYAASNSEAAFEALVSRRIAFVYSAAIRQVRDPHLAEEITQAVFVILAQKAGRISDKSMLTGWLFKTTRFVVLAEIRAAAKRQRAKESLMHADLEPSAPDALWEKMSPLLDEALAHLSEIDRHAVLLRFFENKNLAEVGNSLGTGEDTARKRVSRALEKLRKFYARRGVVATAAIMAGLISANSAQAAAPAALIKTISIAARGKGAVIGSSTSTLVNQTLEWIALAKAKTVLWVSAAAILVVGTGLFAINEFHLVENEDASVWTSERLDLLPPLLILRPANDGLFQKNKRQPNATQYDFNPPRIVFSALAPDGKSDLVVRPTHAISGQGYFIFGEKVRGQREPFTTLFAAAYDFSPQRIVSSAPLPDGRFDFLATVPDARSALRSKIQEHLKLVGRKETRLVDCLLLQIKNRNASGLKPPKDNNIVTGTFSLGDVEICSSSMENWSRALEKIVRQPVVDRTNLDGRFDMRFRWNPHDRSLQSINNALLDQLGLELVPGREEIEMLIVEKAR